MAVSGGSYYKDHLPVLKVELKKSQSGLTTGDKVIIQVSEEKLQELCDGHGGWNADMKMVRNSYLTLLFNILAGCDIY